MIWMLFLHGCNGNQQEKNETQGPMGQMQHVGQMPGGMMPGLSPVENLQSSWRQDLAQKTASEAAKKECPDKDGDGFVSAIACPWNPIKTLDCDDTNPKITPEQELWIPPGLFIMGSASDHAGADEKPVHLVELSGFCLDKNEVTSKEWAKWLQNEQRRPMGKDVRNVNKNGTLVSGKGDFPAEGVTFEEAKAFCASNGKQLPTEAQWEKAARGGCELGRDKTRCDPEDLRPYPWGKATPNCNKANHQLSTTGMPRLCRSDTISIKENSQGDGPYGHRHLAGNVWEYVADYWHPKVYSQKMRKDPSGPKTGEVHVLRGGGWNTFSTNMRAANRFHDLVMGSATGFRCARPTEKSIPDSVAPLEMTTISGTVYAGSLEQLSGRALYISAFDAADANEQGMLAPGRSPVAEVKLTPNGQDKQAFELRLPKGMKAIVSSALDAGTGAKKEQYKSASGSGGFGNAAQNPINTQSTTSGISISLSKAPGPPPQP